MPQTGSPASGWMWKGVAIVAVGLAGFVASNQGWIDFARLPFVGRFFPQPVHEAPTPEVDLETSIEEMELPEHIAEAQHEPDASDEERLDEAELELIEGQGTEISKAGHEEGSEDSTETESDSPPAPLGDSPTRRSTGRRPKPPISEATSDESSVDDEEIEAKPFRSTRSGKSRSESKTRKVSQTTDEPTQRLMNLEEIDALIADNELLAAQKALTDWFITRPKERATIQARLNKLSQQLFFAPQPHVFEPYTVEPGDQLRTIGKKHQVSWEYLAKLNKVSPSKIRAGQKLKVVQGPFAVLVSLSRYELIVHCDGCYVKHYKVGTGKDGSSPLGTFTVKNKQVDPTYYGPDGVIANDDPENPLGERWIDIGDSFGIHGTNEPTSIGKAESRGCIRMKNEDVAEVYDFLIVGSEVRIVK